MNSDPKSICTAKPLWPSSCTALFSHTGLNVSCWIMGLLTILLNITSTCAIVVQWHKCGELNDYDRYVMLINSCDLIVGLYLLTVAIKDVIVGNNYVDSDILWRSSITCHAVAFVSLWSILVEALFIMTISIARYKVVKDPFEKPFGKKCTIFNVVFFPLIFAILIFMAIFLRHQVEGLSYLSSALCIILGKTDKSISQQVVTILVPLYLIIILGVTLIFYIKLFYSSKQSAGILNEVKKTERIKAISRNVILAGTTNAICWIPSSLFYLISVFVAEFPVLVLYWMILVVLPTNAMMNPIIFNLSNIKKN